MAGKKRKKWTLRTEEEKRKILADWAAGESAAVVAKRHGVLPVQIFAWSKKLGVRGPVGKGKSKGKSKDKPKHVNGEGRLLTPEAMFDARVREATIYLRHAQEEVERLKRQRKIKEPDTAHLLAQLALRKLQGDNGT